MENNQNAVTQTDDKTVVVDAQTTGQNEQKTFTQEEVNAMILKAETKVNKKYEGVDLKAYNEWKESQKTEAEKQQDILNENQSLKNRIAELENLSVVANAGVDLKFQKFVFSEVSKEGNFEDNLKEYLKENPQYLQTNVTAEPSKTTGVAVQKINENAESGVSSILKAKHPELFK